MWSLDRARRSSYRTGSGKEAGSSRAVHLRFLARPWPPAMILRITRLAKVRIWLNAIRTMPMLFAGCAPSRCGRTLDGNVLRGAIADAIIAILGSLVDVDISEELSRHEQLTETQRQQ